MYISLSLVLGILQSAWISLWLQLSCLKLGHTLECLSREDFSILQSSFGSPLQSFTFHRAHSASVTQGESPLPTLLCTMWSFSSVEHVPKPAIAGSQDTVEHALSEKHDILSISFQILEYLHLSTYPSIHPLSLDGPQPNHKIHIWVSLILVLLLAHHMIPDVNFPLVASGLCSRVFEHWSNSDLGLSG